MPIPASCTNGQLYGLQGFAMSGIDGGQQEKEILAKFKSHLSDLAEHFAATGDTKGAMVTARDTGRWTQKNRILDQFDNAARNQDGCIGKSCDSAGAHFGKYFNEQ